MLSMKHNDGLAAVSRNWIMTYLLYFAGWMIQVKYCTCTKYESPDCQAFLLIRSRSPDHVLEVEL